MKIGLQTWGSHGDIRPFLVLAEGLQSAGHDVTLAITSVDRAFYEALTPQSGVRIRMISSPVVEDRETLGAIEARVFDESDPLRQTQLIIENLFLPVEASMYAAAEQMCRENDLVIGHFFHYPLHVAAELHETPYVSVALVHSAIPTRQQPPSGLPNLGSMGNRLLWILVRSMLNGKIKKYPDALRAKHGLPPARDLMEDVWASRRLALVAVSPQICTESSRWPDHYRACGFLDKPDVALEGSMPESLAEFLSQGDAPVYMTFGSVMTGANAPETIALLREAAERASVRAIIQAPGWQALGLKSEGKLHFVDMAPYAQVFPHCKAVVHHGGAGTTHSVLLAGKPSVVVPHTSEQAFWGRELARIGASAKPIPRKKLTSDLLARRITDVVGSARILETTRTIGAAMKRENGLATAVEWIESVGRIGGLTPA